jgi:hypothetical protein
MHKQLAEQNFDRHLRQNSYPGRGLVVGRGEDGAWLMLYWMMGRSPNSRNRHFVAAGGTLRTEPLDPSLVADPSLIIYEAMLDLPGTFLVSNGDQTRTIYEALQAGGSFDAALQTREREPDAPNYTPRISAMLRPTDPYPLTFSILKANLFDPRWTDRFTYQPASPPPGFGYGLTTYLGDGNPLPSYRGDPLLLPLFGTPQQLLATYWAALHRENRIALALKRVAGAEVRLWLQNKTSLEIGD